ncbi:hypothetical protein B0H13DRAFT_2350157 [Mycena leptocephala]|nr:hypothetical protein B0H13DRAFT_2350157 [Mycena leptocephala]
MHSFLVRPSVPISISVLNPFLPLLTHVLIPSFCHLSSPLLAIVSSSSYSPTLIHFPQRIYVSILIPFSALPSPILLPNIFDS